MSGNVLFFCSSNPQASQVYCDRPNQNFFNDSYSKPPKKKYPNNKVFYTHIDEKWSNDLADFSDYMTSNNKRFRYIFVIIVNVFE